MVAAVEASGRCKLLMGGISTDICLTCATMAAADAGFEVYFVYPNTDLAGDGSAYPSWRKGNART